MKKLLPLILLFVGAGAGVGAGIMLRPEAPAEVPHAADDASATEGEDAAAEHSAPEEDPEESTEGEENTNEYVKLNNQFVIPIVTGEKVAALVVLALSIEVPTGQTDIVYGREPKLRDSFLQVLFDHANMGGFEGNFTNAEVLGRLRTALKEVAQKDLGKSVVKDVLIIEIARQDY